MLQLTNPSAPSCARTRRGGASVSAAAGRPLLRPRRLAASRTVAAAAKGPSPQPQPQEGLGSHAATKKAAAPAPAPAGPEAPGGATHGAHTVAAAAVVAVVTVTAPRPATAEAAALSDLTAVAADPGSAGRLAASVAGGGGRGDVIDVAVADSDEELDCSGTGEIVPAGECGLCAYSEVCRACEGGW
jgi:hypothetical protein